MARRQWCVAKRRARPRQLPPFRSRPVLPGPLYARSYRKYFECNILRATRFDTIFCEADSWPLLYFQYFADGTGEGVLPSSRNQLPPRAPESGRKSFECNILHVTRFDTIFCEEDLSPPIYFQYF